MHRQMHIVMNILVTAEFLAILLCIAEALEGLKIYIMMRRECKTLFIKQLQMIILIYRSVLQINNKRVIFEKNINPK